MNLKEMEDAARKRQEENAATAELENAALLSAEAETRSNLESLAAEFLAQMTGAPLEELDSIISVSDWGAWHCSVVVSLPEHSRLQTRIRFDKNGVMRWEHNDKRWQISDYSCGGSRYCRELGDALAIAACLWAETEEAEQKAAEQAERQEAQRQQRKLNRIERGLHYVGIFEDHPFLKPIFDLLVTYVEDKEVFEADLDAAEEFAASMDESYMRKLNESRMAQAEADNARHRLQQDLWAEQEARRNLERERRKW